MARSPGGVAAAEGVVPPEGHTRCEVPWETQLILTTALGERHICPFFPSLGGKMCVCVCARLCICTRDSDHRTSGSRDLGTTRLHLQQPHMLTPGAQGPKFAQKPKLLTMSSPACLGAQQHLSDL